MKKLISLLLVAAVLLAACSAYAESSGFDYSALDESMPVNQPAEDVEDEGGEGTIEVADASVEPTGDAVSVEGFIPDDADKVIIGSDDRITVTKPGQYPFSTIAYMEVTGECGDQWVCTGFMVGKNCLLTAAHCMICPNHGKWAKKATFYFGFKSKSNCLYKYTGGWFGRAGTNFPNHRYDSEALSNDWCYLILDKNVGEKTGWLGFNCASDSEIRSHTYMVAGYRDYKLKYCWGNAEPYDSRVVGFTADDQPGNSGGPIFMTDNQAEAIIIAENETMQVNFGRRITSDIWSWMQKDGYK